MLEDEMTVRAKRIIRSKGAGGNHFTNLAECHAEVNREGNRIPRVARRELLRQRWCEHGLGTCLLLLCNRERGWLQKRERDQH